MRDMSADFIEYTSLERKRTREGLSVAELERWSALKSRLGQGKQPGSDNSPQDRRASVRVPTRLNASFESLGQLESSVITNLSLGGVFIQTASPLPVGTMLTLRIRIEETDAVIEIPGRVVRSQSGSSTAEDDGGMGIEFAEVVPEMMELLADFYERAIQRELGLTPDASRE